MRKREFLRRIGCNSFEETIREYVKMREKIDKIETCVGTFERKKYECQKTFKLRVNEEFRKKITSSFKYDFRDKKENLVILRFPILDLFGNSILDYQFNHNTSYPELFLKYIRLKIRFKE